MPIVDRKSGLVPNNARNADVAHRMIEHIAPMQQQRTQAAFRVNGIQAILYNKLTQGPSCVCHSKSNEVARLSPDGKASTGIINRVLTGNSNFGIRSYAPEDQDLELDPYNAPTSPLSVNKWRGDNTKISQEPTAGFSDMTFGPELSDVGQFSPDLDDMFNGFDMSHLGISDISCPICFGTGFVGGYVPFRAWRKVLLGTDLQTDSFQDLPSFELTPGTHTVMVTLPRGAITIDVFRTMLNSKATSSKLYLDGHDLSSRRVLDFFDGRPHELKIVTNESLTHVELQVSLSNEPVYFEVPKLARAADLSFLDQQEPFSIMMSPDIPMLQPLDVIAETQLGKFLIVQQATQWNTRNRNMLGTECQVRVAQPQELWNILPKRRPTGQKRVRGAAPTQQKALSGVFSF
jgi:hypothetical protein